jgi:hypothetical protein
MISPVGGYLEHALLGAELADFCVELLIVAVIKTECVLRLRGHPLDLHHTTHEETVSLSQKKRCVCGHNVP